SSSGANCLARYWQNGQPTDLPNGAGSAAVSIAAFGSDIYVVGGQQDIAESWKNGTSSVLANATGAQANQVVLSNKDVYVAGGAGGVAQYWKNGVSVGLRLSGQNSMANGIAIVQH